MNKYISPAILLTATIAAYASGASAQTATASFDVTITIQADCEVTTPQTLAFGTSGVLATANDKSASLGVTCTSGVPYDIGLNAGTGPGATVTSRVMRLGGTGTEKVSYQIYKDSNRTAVWGNTVSTNTLTGTGTGALQSIPVYGRVPSQDTPPVGAYSDTVTATLTF